ncbi:MAG: Holliday junction resolvase RuvX [Alphaproteobacteria bacterium]|nr:Holliday junction resolvase RuvX [Alphaproteobacteria bacterium]
MIVRNLSEIPALLGKGECLLGLDYGRKVIGVAVSDPGLCVASPLVSLVRKKFAADAEALAAIITERKIGGVVLGLPKNMDGTEGPTAQAVRTFVHNLSKPGLLPRDDLSVAFWDERLSTAAVERFLIEGDMSRKRRGEVVDKMAAAYILQNALDALRFCRADT